MLRNHEFLHEAVRVRGVPTLQTRVLLDRLHCHDESDSFGSGEPYLWTVFFKVDGETAVLDLIGDAVDDDEKTVGDIFLRGTCTVATTPGSHGNLGDRDVVAGDDVRIPLTLGQFETSLTPIAVTERARSKLGEILGEVVDTIGGTIGVVAVLMEENLLSDADAEAGHAELNRSVEQGINELIPQLGVLKQEVTQQDIAELTDRAATAVEAAIRDALSAWEAVTAYLRADHKIGSVVFRAGHQALMDEPIQKHSARLQRLVDVPPSTVPGSGRGPLPSPSQPQRVVAQDYELFGAIRARRWGPWSSVSEGRSTPGAPVTAVALPGEAGRLALFLADPAGGVYTASGSAG